MTDTYYSCAVINPNPWGLEDVIHEYPNGTKVLLRSVGYDYGAAAADYKNTARGAGAAVHKRIDPMDFQRLANECLPPNEED